MGDLDNWYSQKPPAEDAPDEHPGEPEQDPTSQFAPPDMEAETGVPWAAGSGYIGFEPVEQHSVEDLDATRLDQPAADDAGDMPRQSGGPLPPDDDDGSNPTVVSPRVLPNRPGRPGAPGGRPPRFAPPRSGSGRPGPPPRPGAPGGSPRPGPATAPLRQQGGPPRDGQRKSRRTFGLLLLALLAIVLIALIAIGVVPNPLKLVGLASSSAKPHASNSANAGGAPIQASSAPAAQGSPGGGIVAPSGSHSSSASASTGAPSATASATPTATAGTPPGAAAATGATVCVTTNGWNTDPQVTSPVHRQVPIVSATPGVHGNCDRLVLVLKGGHPFPRGTKLGIDARYARTIRTDPKGDLVPLEGRPAIKLVILAPSHLPVHNGYVVSPDQLRNIAASVNSSFKEIQWVKFGGSFEGHTTLVVSVRDRHPFAAFVSVDRQGNLVVVLDVAALAHGDMPSPAPSSTEQGGD